MRAAGDVSDSFLSFFSSPSALVFCILSAMEKHGAWKTVAACVFHYEASEATTLQCE
jgi:hypothetical protein